MNSPAWNQDTAGPGSSEHHDVQSLHRFHAAVRAASETLGLLHEIWSEDSAVQDGDELYQRATERGYTASKSVFSSQLKLLAERGHLDLSDKPIEQAPAAEAAPEPVEPQAEDDVVATGGDTTPDEAPAADTESGSDEDDGSF